MGSLPVGSVGRSPWPGSVDLESSVDLSKQTPKVGPCGSGGDGIV